MTIKGANPVYPAMTGVELLHRLVEFDGTICGAAQLFIRVDMLFSHCLNSCSISTALFLESDKRFWP